VNILHTVECETCHAKVGQRCRNPHTLVPCPGVYQHPKREKAARAAGRDAEVVAGLGGGG